MQLSAVFGAVRVISETMATLPWHVKQSTDGMVRNADAHPINKLIHDTEPIDVGFYIPRGVSSKSMFARKRIHCNQTRQRGKPNQIDSDCNPNAYEVKIYEDEKFYQIDDKETFDDSEMIHIVGLGFDGVIGKSVIECARESIGLGLAADQFGGSFFGNGANISAVSDTSPSRLSDEAYKRLMRSWSQRNTGMGNSHKTAILEEGMNVDQRCPFHRKIHNSFPRGNLALKI